jgi:hypothetical protein
MHVPPISQFMHVTYIVRLAWLHPAFGFRAGRSLGTDPLS